MTPEPPSSRIREAGPSDRDAVHELARASGLFPPEELDDARTTFDAFLAGGAGGAGGAGSDRWLVDDAGAGAVAVAYYAPERMAEGTWNLYLLAVHPSQRGQGKGAALVAHVEQDLRRAGARVLLIETSAVPDFARQRDFYAGLGYDEEARIRDFYGDGDDKVVYWKHLRPT